MEASEERLVREALIHERIRVLLERQLDADPE